MPPPMSPCQKGGAFSDRDVDGSQSRQHRRAPSQGAIRPTPFRGCVATRSTTEAQSLATGAQREKKHRRGLGISALHSGLTPRHETPSSVWFNASDSQRGVSRIPSPFFCGASATEKGLASLSAKPFMLLVEPTGIEPVTSTMPL